MSAPTFFGARRSTAAMPAPLRHRVSRISGRPGLRRATAGEAGLHEHPRRADEQADRALSRATGPSGTPRPAWRRFALAKAMPPATSRCVRPCPRAPERMKKQEIAHDRRIGRIGRIERRRAAAGIVPFRNVGRGPICIQPTRTAVGDRQQAGRRPGLDARPDHGPCCAARSLARRAAGGSPKMRAPAAVAGTLLAEQVLERRPQLRHRAEQCFRSRKVLRALVQLGPVG